MNVGTLSIMLMANTTGLIAGTQAVYRMERAMSASSGRMNAAMASSSIAAATFGKNITQYVTLPVTLIGVVAVKAFSEFEYGLAKVNGLIGIAKEQVNGFGTEILKLGTALGRTPKELVQALYMVTTSGMRGADVMDVLTVATKGAIAGLGDVSQVADIVTSAMNAYGKENLSAAKTLDIVTATVREGKAEADKLITSMGIATPIASKLGVSFDQVGAAMAAMTRTGTVTSTAATQVRQMLFTFIKPSEVAKNKMKEMGSSFGELRKILREDGLIAALAKVQEVTGGLPENMAAIFRNVRAINGVMDIMGEHFEENLLLFDRIANSSGNLDTAFMAVADTIKIRLVKISAGWQEQMIKLGQFLSAGLLPILEMLMTAITGIGTAFSYLPKFVQTFLAGIVAIVAIGGPLILIFMGLKGAVVALGASFTALMAPIIGIQEVLVGMGGLGAATTGAVFFEITAVVLALVAAYHALKFAFAEASNASDIFDSAITNSTNSVIAEKQYIQSLLQILDSNIVSIKDKGEALDRLRAINLDYFGDLQMEEGLVNKATNAAKTYLQTMTDLEKMKNLVAGKQKIQQDLLQEVAKPNREIKSGTAQWDVTMNFFKHLKLNKYKKEAIASIEKSNEEIIAVVDSVTREFDKKYSKMWSSINNVAPIKAVSNLSEIKSELTSMISVMQGVQSESSGIIAEKAGTQLVQYNAMLEQLNRRLEYFGELAGVNSDLAFLDPDDLQKMSDYEESLAEVNMLLGYLGKRYDAIGASISIYMEELKSGLYTDERKQEIADTILGLYAQKEAQDKLTRTQEALIESNKKYKDSINDIVVRQQLFGKTYDSASAHLSALKARYDDLAKGAKGATKEMTELATAIMNMESLANFERITKKVDMFAKPELTGFQKQGVSSISDIFGKDFNSDTNKFNKLQGGLDQFKLPPKANEDINENIKLMMAWKTALNAVVSIFQQLGNIVGGAFGEIIGKLTPYISLVSQVLGLLKAIGVIEDINTAKKIANTSVTAAGIPVVLGAASAQQALAVANTEVAITGAAASVSWIPIVGIGLAIAGVAALLLTLNSSKNKGANMATGGIVPAGYPNDTFPANLTSNEAVIPLDRMPEMLGLNNKKRSGKVEFVISGRVLKGILRDADLMEGIA